MQQEVNAKGQRREDAERNNEQTAALPHCGQYGPVAGIADPPVTPLAKLIGGVWIVLGSTLFFGAIVATVTAYFMRPLQRPARQIVETIEFNLEHLDALSIEELDLLKSTVDTLIEHMERVKRLRGQQAAGAHE